MSYSHLIIGSGVIGLSIAQSIKEKNKQAKIIIIEKESQEAFHASGRNSGVLHAGFYYTADSLKAKLCAQGNRRWKGFCNKHHLKLNNCQKLVVAQTQDEVKTLYELEKRGKANGVNVEIIDEHQAKDIEPNVKTFSKALYSPDTASIDPVEICNTLKRILEAQGVTFQFNCAYKAKSSDGVISTHGEIKAQKTINCAGLYADKIAHDFGFGKTFTIIPFKGLYLKYTLNKTDIKTNIYPVPNLKNPFLGVHFTKTVDGSIKIGPTATPAFWRENYRRFDRFKFGEFLSIAGTEAKLYFGNYFGFRDLATEEMKKYDKQYFVKLASNMVQNINPEGFTEFTTPGIRAQLLNKETNALIQDFVVESDERSIHVLNAVSPAFTCALSFADHIRDTHHLL